MANNISNKGPKANNPRNSAGNNAGNSAGNSASKSGNSSSKSGNSSSKSGNNASRSANSSSRSANSSSSGNNSGTNSSNRGSNTSVKSPRGNNVNSLSFNSNNSYNNSNNNSNNTANNSSNLISNIANKARNSVKPKSNTIIYVGIGILIIVLIIAGYFIYRYYKTNRTSQVVTKNFIPLIHDASIDKRINYGSIPESSQGNEYNINMWVYVSDYVYRKDEDKCILYKGDVIGTLNNGEPENNVNTKCNPSLWLLKNVNTLRVLIGLETTYDSRQDCNQTAQACGEVIESETCDIENFPLQKWVSVNISLRSNVLDIFLDGNLYKSCILSGFPIINKGDLYICKDGGYNGYLSNLRYSNKALSSSEIAKIYKNGPTLK